MTTTEIDSEANAFAFELLMPFDLVRKDIVGLDMCDEQSVAAIAKRYRVPTSVMAMRLEAVRSALAKHGGAS